MARDVVAEEGRLASAAPRGTIWLVRRPGPPHDGATAATGSDAGPGSPERAPARAPEAPGRIAENRLGEPAAAGAGGRPGAEGEVRDHGAGTSALAEEAITFSSLQELIDICAAHSRTAAFLRVELQAVTGGKNRRLVLDFGQFSAWPD